jgi:hypothetical protein
LLPRRPPPPGPGAPAAAVHNGPRALDITYSAAGGTFTVTNARNGFSKTHKAGLQLH